MKIFKISILIFISLFLTACYNIDNEIEDMRSLHQSFVNDLEQPVIKNSGEYYRSYSINEKNTVLDYEIYISDYTECINFLKFNLNTDNIFWNKIEILNIDGFGNEISKKLLENKKFQLYEPSKYCSSGLTFRLQLDKEKSDLNHIKEIYLKEANQRMLADKEIREVSYIMELYNMFMQNRDVIIREESIGGREIYVEYRNERNQQKEDRIRLNIEYNNVSKKFCSDVLDVMVNDITNRHYNGTNIQGLEWESIILNGEQLTIDYRYNNENVCHLNNSFKFVIYNPFDE